MINIFKKLKLKKEKGFTLVESLLSIALILIAVIGPLSLTLNSINIIRQNRNRVIASYLAEETIENFRAYRDGFVLACKDISITRDSNGDPVYAECTGGGASITLIGPAFSLLQSGSYTSNTVGWNLFLASLNQLPTNTNNKFYLDRTSFPFNNLNASVAELSCDYLYLDSSNVYTCSNSSGTQTEFKRTVLLDKIDNNSLRVEVEVTYTRSYLFGILDKSVKVVDYIYER